MTRADEARSPQVELFDLTADPYERFDVAGAHPDVVDRLTARLLAFARETGARTALARGGPPGSR